MKSALPRWPDKADYYDSKALSANIDPQARYAEAFYERASADAAIARLKVAVDGMLDAKLELADDCPMSAERCLDEALAQIEGK